MAGKKTSNPSWIKKLGQKQRQAAETKKKSKDTTSGLRVALVGVGSELNGDDAAGVQVAREISLAAGLPADFLALDSGSIPENASGPLRRFHPDLVIFVDAADLGSEPGTIAWLDKNRIEGMTASSHTLPLTMMGGFLEGELGCQVEYMGIQPGQLEFGSELSPKVRTAVTEIVEGFISKFKSAD